MAVLTPLSCEASVRNRFRQVFWLTDQPGFRAFPSRLRRRTGPSTGKQLSGQLRKRSPFTAARPRRIPARLPRVAFCHRLPFSLAPVAAHRFGDGVHLRAPNPILRRSRHRRGGEHSVCALFINLGRLARWSVSSRDGRLFSPQSTQGFWQAGRVSVPVHCMSRPAGSASSLWPRAGNIHSLATSERSLAPPLPITSISGATGSMFL
jgi:hypothetical protein